MRQPLLQKASSQSATICAHSERGNLYHSMQPSGNGRQQRKLSELAALTARDGWSAGPFFLALPGKKKDLSRSPFSRCAYRLSAGPNRKTSAIDETSTQSPPFPTALSLWPIVEEQQMPELSSYSRQGQRWGQIMKVKNYYTLERWNIHSVENMKVSGYAAQFCQCQYLINQKKNTFKGPECKFLPDLQFLYL